MQLYLSHIGSVLVLAGRFMLLAISAHNTNPAKGSSGAGPDSSAAVMATHTFSAWILIPYSTDFEWVRSAAPAGPEGDSTMVLDRTWLVHLPKVGWWLACEGNLGYFIWRLYQPDNTHDGSCNAPGWQQTASALIVVRYCTSALAALCVLHTQL